VGPGKEAWEDSPSGDLSGTYDLVYKHLRGGGKSELGKEGAIDLIRGKGRSV